MIHPQDSQLAARLIEQFEYDEMTTEEYVDLLRHDLAHNSTVHSVGRSYPMRSVIGRGPSDSYPIIRP